MNSAPEPKDRNKHSTRSPSPPPHASTRQHKPQPHTKNLTSPPHIPISARFFRTVSDYLRVEHPAEATTDRVFVVLKGKRRGQPLSEEGLKQIFVSARQRAGLRRITCHELRHTCFTRLREAGMELEAL